MVRYVSLPRVFVFEELLDLATHSVERARELGAKLAITRIQRRTYERIVYDNGTLREYSFSTVVGLGIKVYTNNGVGYSYTTSLDRESIENCIKQALSMANHGYTTPNPYVLNQGIARFYRTPVSKDPFTIDPGEKISLIKELNTESMKIEGIASCTTFMGLERDVRIVVTSEGVQSVSEITLCGIGHTVVAKDGSSMERVGDSRTFVGGYETIRRYDWQNFVNELNNLAKQAVRAPTPSPGKYVAVVDNELVGLLIHEAFGHACEGDYVERGGSILQGKIGQKVASEYVTIVDQGLVEGGYPVVVDDEGIPKGRTTIVDRGILVGYLHSRETANQINVEPTGNARAENVYYDILVRQTNFFVERGDWTPEEMIRDVKHGIYLRGRGARGGQVSPVTGTFTFSVGPSYIIENGELKQLVRGVTVSGHIIETLMSVDAVGRDLVVKTSVFGGCGKGHQMVRVGIGGPHLRLQIVVGGG